MWDESKHENDREVRKTHYCAQRWNMHEQKRKKNKQFHFSFVEAYVYLASILLISQVGIASNMKSPSNKQITILLHLSDGTTHVYMYVASVNTLCLCLHLIVNQALLITVFLNYFTWTQSLALMETEGDSDEDSSEESDGSCTRDSDEVQTHEIDCGHVTEKNFVITKPVKGLKKPVIEEMTTGKKNITCIKKNKKKTGTKKGSRKRKQR